MEKLEKKDGPAPGSYQIEEAISKTQWVEKKTALAKGKLTGFIESYNLLHKHCPGVGTYKDIDKGLDKLSRSPKSLMVKRH